MTRKFARRSPAKDYIADEHLATTVFLQTRLDKPLLIEGPAGVGKTELAKALAAATGRRLLRLQCYEGQDETKALYEWDYGKQLLYTQILREKIGQLVADARDLDEAVDRIGKQESVFFSDRFLASRPLLEAVRSEEPVVLLIDEIDRADESLEAVLLELLGEYQVSVPEIGTFTAKHAPYVVLTSNNTRDLAAALKRRCLHLFLDYPRPNANWRSCGPRTPASPMRWPRSWSSGARAARARSAQGAEHLRDHRLGTHACGARGRRAVGEGAVRHRFGSGQVRQGRSQVARRASALWSIPTRRYPRRCTMGTRHGHDHGSP